MTTAGSGGPPARSDRHVPVGLVVAVVWLVAVTLAALVAPLLPLTDPDVDAGAGLRVPPFELWSHPLGTDAFGRDLLSRVVYGARVSLAAAGASVGIALVIGLALGILAGYFRGTIDHLLGLFFDTVLAFPGLILLLALGAVLRPGLRTIVLGLSIIAFPPFARLARAGTLRVAEAEFVLAARGLGARNRTLLSREILPAVAPPVLAYAAAIMAVLVIVEASLSFLGLGVPVPRPSWGNMIAEGRGYLQASPHLVFVPAGALVLTILALSTIGEWLRSRADAGRP
ncbi:ABC transporter permease [Frankia sp. QA3]|uniref:ABC transporter permease n=1 Tax=Frankia sp. QA3 TaxID=710111 RepID=UPI000269BB6B|nr:ABC transporter permease [Frankia sp. QA3]EIV92626.1 ABC-type dipeptide/oligopeptide/nickel transport system, permease component [Frankia sp. QA3]